MEAVVTGATALTLADVDDPVTAERLQHVAGPGRSVVGPAEHEGMVIHVPADRLQAVQPVDRIELAVLELRQLVRISVPTLVVNGRDRGTGGREEAGPQAGARPPLQGLASPPEKGRWGG